MFQVCVLLFILFIAFWWGSQGAFNALVHLVAVIIAGAFTFAFWELLVLGFTINRMPHYAWGVSFLAIFVIALLIVRKILDLTIKKNLYFGQVPNLVIGGIIGLFAGILSAGISIIGIAYLPLDEEMMGYIPLAIVEKPDQPPAPAPPVPPYQPARHDSLWIAADDITARFFTHLSNSTFYSGESLGVYRPDLFQQAHLFRLKDDGNASPVARPSSVEVGDVSLPTAPVPISPPQALLLGANGATGLKIDGRICCVNTKWNSKDSGTYDTDGLVRIFPTQVRLAVVENPADPEEAQIYAPWAFSVVDPAKPKSRIFVPFLNDRTVAAGSGASDFTFIFVIPENVTPIYISLRGTRFPLPTPDAFKSDSATVTTELGLYTPPPVAAVAVATATKNGTFESNLSGSALLSGLEVNGNLPEAIDRNMVQSEFTYLNGTDILSGNSTVRKPFDGRVDRKVRTEKIGQPAGTIILRAQFEPAHAASLLGSAVAAAASLEAIYITDSGGTRYLPIGYAWWKSTGETQIKVDREALIRSAREIPFREVNPAGDRIFVYWQVPRGSIITGLNIGSKTHYDMDVRTPP